MPEYTCVRESPSAYCEYAQLVAEKLIEHANGATNNRIYHGCFDTASDIEAVMLEIVESNGYNCTFWVRPSCVKSDEFKHNLISVNVCYLDCNDMHVISYVSPKSVPSNQSFADMNAITLRMEAKKKEALESIS